MKVILATVKKDFLRKWEEYFEEYDFISAYNKERLVNALDNIEDEHILILDEDFFQASSKETLDEFKEQYPKARLILLSNRPDFAEARQFSISGYGGLSANKEELQEAYEIVKDGGVWFQTDKIKHNGDDEIESFIEEKEKEHTQEEKQKDVRKAIYSGKFEEYTITPSKTMEGYLVVTDLIDNRDSSDLVSSDIEEFIFSDGVKTYEQIMNRHKLENHEYQGPKKPINKNIIYNHNDNKLYFIEAMIGESLKLDEVYLIEIYIKNYIQRRDSVIFEKLYLLNEINFRYSLGNTSLDIVFEGKMNKEEYTKLLNSFTYEDFNKSEKHKDMEIELKINNSKQYLSKVSFV